MPGKKKAVSKKKSVAKKKVARKKKPTAAQEQALLESTGPLRARVERILASK